MDRTVLEDGERGGKKMAFNQIREVFSKMPELFNPTAAEGMDAVFQFNITGEGGGNWYLTVKDGNCQVNEGIHDAPTVTLTISGQDWLAIVNRDLSGIQAFMSGKLKVSGDLMLAQKISGIFSF